MCFDELGFSMVIEELAKQDVPIIGHNAIYDLCFIYHQFYEELPETYAEFAYRLHTKLFSKVYDTKVMSIFAGSMGKSDLQTLYNKSTQDKKFNNNLTFAPDPAHSDFAIY